MARCDLELHLHAKMKASECTKKAKAIAKSQLVVEGRKVIIQEHLAEKCDSFAETISVSPMAAKVDAISLTEKREQFSNNVSCTHSVKTHHKQKS
jgi:hypothetical protein